MAKPSKPSTSTSGSIRVLFWYRTDLRLHDSPALTAALSLSPSISAFYPVWCWDPHYVYRARVGPNRFQFLLDCQTDLSSSLTALNPKQKLLVVREAPQTVLPKLIKEWGITHLCFEKDTDAYSRRRDEEVSRMARELGVEVVVRSGRTLWDSDELVKANGGKATMSITQVQHVRNSQLNGMFALLWQTLRDVLAWHPRPVRCSARYDVERFCSDAAHS